MSEWVLAEQRRRLRWVGLVAHTGDKGHACKVLPGKSECKRLLGRPRHESIILTWVLRTEDGKSSTGFKRLGYRHGGRLLQP
jgi:hypothetical protein